MKFKIAIFTLISAISLCNAQVKKWTLEECVTYAVEHNISVAQFNLDLESVKLDKSDALGAFIPSLNGQASVSGNTGLILDPTTNNLVSGTIMSSSMNLTSSVTLFDGLRNFKNLQRAKLNAIAGQYRLDDLVDDIRLNVANAYLQILSNKEALKVAKAQLAVTEQDLNRTKELVDAGVVPKGDLLELEATVASQQQQIVNNEGLVLISKINLAQFLQITDYDSFDIADDSFEVPPTSILDNSAKTIFDKALTFRNDIQLSQANVDLAAKDVEIAKGAYMPTLGAFFNYNTRYSDQNRNPFTGEDLNFIDQLWLNDGISYGAQLNVPIFNGWSTRNNVTRAKIALDRTKLQYEADKLALEATIQQSYVDVKTFGKAYEAAQKTLEARRIAYDYAKDRFEVGLMNSFDFSQAQSRVDDAEANVIRTKYDYIFRIKILEFYFGLPIQLN
ncbi:TolC family protein [Flavobacterium sp. ASW18X]|uniref:TolC family protein n=1 Tax=Flavobacterium sp. ASW18X TaxID=2572595 RepID=UPI0010AE85FA|nr:TolC family protein [Flavobacterium sp. ASW18X]TKD66653.1 TolC family protein [Flavobacterium sp. ASW18X]